MTHEEVCKEYMATLQKIMDDKTTIDTLYGAVASHFELVKLLHNTAMIEVIESYHGGEE